MEGQQQPHPFLQGQQQQHPFLQGQQRQHPFLSGQPQPPPPLPSQQQPSPHLRNRAIIQDATSRTNSSNLLVDPVMFATDGPGTGASQLEPSVHNLKKLEDDTRKLGLEIKYHEDNISFLKRQIHQTDNTIIDLQVAIGKYISASTRMPGNENPADEHGDEETIQQILKTENTAAALLYQLQSQHDLASHHLWMKDVVGIVATLGKFEDDNLSRVLSEYLGMETMLAVVCKIHACVKALETYNKEGLVNKTSGIHELGASIGRPLEGRFLAICLENMRPYAGDFVANDSQRRLDLLKPRLPNGEIPPGFLGYAVNMINIDHNHLNFVTTNGLGLRETLFFNLFSRVHVYKTREDMSQALPFIIEGAVSLDGGIMRGSSTYYLGKQRQVHLGFPKCSKQPMVPQILFEYETALKEEKWKKERLQIDIRREITDQGNSKFNFEIKKQEFVAMLAQSSSYAAQQKQHQPAQEKMAHR